MPLYLEDFATTDLPEAYELAILQIVAATKDLPINPATAVQMIRSFIEPLLPEKLRVLLELKGQPSWQRIEALYPRLVFTSDQGREADLIAAATLIHILVRHTTRPPRELPYPPFVEVSSFSRISGYLGLPIASPLVLVSDVFVDIYDFCKYCWLPVHSQGVCRFHTTRNLPPNSLDGQPICANLSFKQAQRLRPEFEKQVLSLVSAQELEFHHSDFTMPVLMPPSGLRNWLQRYRPRLALLVGPAVEMPDARVLQDLLSTLYGPLGLDVAKVIGGAVHLLTPISARAEGWLSAWESRPSRGGSRRSVHGNKAVPQLGA